MFLHHKDPKRFPSQHQAPYFITKYEICVMKQICRQASPGVLTAQYAFLRKASRKKAELMPFNVSQLLKSHSAEDHIRKMLINNSTAAST